MKKLTGCIALMMLFYFYGCATAPVTPLTDTNVHELVGKWEGTRSGTIGGAGHGSMGGVRMEVFSASPVRAKLYFDGTPRGTLTFGLQEGKIYNGFLVGDLKGHGSPAIKLGLERTEAGLLKLRGTYWSTMAAVNFGGDMRLEKIRE